MVYEVALDIAFEVLCVVICSDCTLLCSVACGMTALFPILAEHEMAVLGLTQTKSSGIKVTEAACDAAGGGGI